MVIILPLISFSLHYNRKYYKNKSNKIAAGILGIFTSFIIFGILVLIDKAKADEVEV